MRELTSHKVNDCNEAIRVDALDGSGIGGASHVYRLSWPTVFNGVNDEDEITIKFQNGPIAEVGTNGVTHEALLAILIDRLEGFQSGPYACNENARAMQHLKDAQAILHLRTAKRLARGVEGTHAV